ncbi:hypothetical protein [Kistimonas asteriae]|uniref:hypothetical protein n=1 Tax=Kistimonas asteriae TaxID=517724 RepID=UPI001BA74265|nr:hypothetical protein [Kistimonas asteriae]
MASYKIMKLSNNGEDFGYLTYGNDIFYGGGKKEDAVKLEPVKYPKLEGAYYYKVKGSKRYMDIRSNGQRIEGVEYNISLSMSTIVAWLHDSSGELQSVVGGKEMPNKVSRSMKDPKSQALYGNARGTHCKITIEDA